MTNKVTYNIFSLRSIWKRIMARNKAIRPTQSYEYYRYLCFAFYSRLLKVGHWRMLFHVFSNDSEECIIPLVVNRKRRQIRSVSYYGRLDYDDIISSTASEVFIRECLSELCSFYVDYDIVWKNINEQGLLYPVLKEMTVLQEPCVAIRMPLSYDDYYASLSKHQRQNIRTSYNRLAADGISFSLDYFDEVHPINSSVWHQCEQMYEARHDYMVSNPFRQWWERYTNPYHHIMINHPERLIFVLYTNSTPIAYMAGLYSREQKSYYIPRLCIDEQYSRYSPGIVLVNEVAKRLISMGTEVMDLMEGDEPYKLAMGGFVHNNYLLQTNTQNILQYVHTA